MLVRFALNDAYYRKLTDAAHAAGMSMQDFIRYKLFGEACILTVDEAVKRIQGGDFEGKHFTLPDVFGDSWPIGRQEGTGSLGKRFYAYVVEHPETGIRFVPDFKINRRTVYSYSSKKKGGDLID